MTEESNFNLHNVAEFIWEMVKTAVTVVIIVYLTKTYVFQLFSVDGQSMEPNLHHKQMILVDKLSYLFRTPHRGEIIVFEKPGAKNVNFIKRVIGLPGETVEIHQNKITIKNNLYPDGFTIAEEYIPNDYPTNGDYEYTVNDNEVFVLGDNRTNSQDSRMLGPIPIDHIIGRALFTYWPINEAYWLFTPDYQMKTAFLSPIPDYYRPLLT